MIRPLVALAMLVALAACEAPMAPRAAAPAPALTQVSTASVPTELTQINALRRAAGVGALQPSAALDRAAELHAADMVRSGYFSHTGTNGSSVGDRARQQGYRYGLIAENIAQGDPSLAAVLDSWMGSSGHRRNLLNRRVTDYGLAQNGRTWVMVLGTPR